MPMSSHSNTMSVHIGNSFFGELAGKLKLHSKCHTFCYGHVRVAYSNQILLHETCYIQHIACIIRSREFFSRVCTGIRPTRGHHSCITILALGIWRREYSAAYCPEACPDSAGDSTLWCSKNQIGLIYSADNAAVWHRASRVRAAGAHWWEAQGACAWEKTHNQTSGTSNNI